MRNIRSPSNTGIWIGPPRLWIMSGIRFGAYAAPTPGQDSEQALVELEAKLGRTLGAHRVFRTWDDPTRDLIAARDVARGRLPVVSWRPGHHDGSKVSWGEIAAGKHDLQIRAIADNLGALPGPVVVCLHHEPELATGYGEPEQFVTAFRRWRSIFATVGAHNVEHAVIASPVAYRDHGARMEALWPGDTAVDWVGVNAYNWHGCAHGQEPAWVPLGNSCRSAVAFAERHDKPVLIAEWGSVEDPADPTRKARWIGSALVWAKATPRVRAMLYLHARGSCPWWLDSSPQSLAAFRAMGADPYTTHR
jgi:hypothetical protein